MGFNYKSSTVKKCNTQKGILAEFLFYEGLKQIKMLNCALVIDVEPKEEINKTIALNVIQAFTFLLFFFNFQHLFFT